MSPLDETAFCESDKFLIENDVLIVIVSGKRFKVVLHDGGKVSLEAI